MMRVSQTGHDSVSMQVHDSSVLAGVLLRVTIGTDKDYSVTLLSRSLPRAAGAR